MENNNLVNILHIGYEKTKQKNKDETYVKHLAPAIKCDYLL